MKAGRILRVVLMTGWLFAIVLNGCVEPIDFEVPPAQLQTVVEGMISDDPGPYVVKVSQGISLNADSLKPAPVENVKIRLHDDQGNVEEFVETSPGVYMTGGIMQGQVGRTYHITLETPDGKTFQSEPERIDPVGEVEDIRYEFEARTVQNFFGETSADVFNIYVDADAGNVEEPYVRWRFKGTYKIVSHPELRMTHNPPYLPYKDPPPCSGYVVVEFILGGKIEQVEDCTCCTCWVNQFETKPQLSDGQLISNKAFKNVKIAEVPVNNITFHDKYLVEVEQMSLSKTAFEFFKLIREQKENASDLFQPPSGEIKGNLKPLNSDEPVIGLFWATSIKRKSIFIHRDEVPYPLTPITFFTDDCTTYYPHSFTEKPALWED